MNDIKISVIVPVYNVEKFLPECIESLINQTLKLFEIILVDDGSPDNCGAICDKYALQYDNIKVIHKTNGGLSDARNAGIEIATGEWIAFVDSDDYIDKHMYEKLYKNIEQYNADLSMCDFQWVNENGMSLDMDSEIEYQIGCVTEETIYNQLNEVYAGHYVIAWNKLYHKSLFEHLRFPKGKVNEDQFIMHEIFYAAKRIACTDEKLYKYRKVTGSIMNSGFSVRRLDDIEGLHKRFVFYNMNKLYQRLYRTERLTFNKLKMYLKRLEIDSTNENRVSELLRRHKECYGVASKYHSYSAKEKAERFVMFNATKLYWILAKRR